MSLTNATKVIGFEVRWSEFVTRLETGPWRIPYVKVSSIYCLVMMGLSHLLRTRLVFGEQGWRSGESIRLPPVWPGFDSQTRCHMWVEFVVGSRPCSECFSPGSPVFPSPQKPTFSNSNIHVEHAQFKLIYFIHLYISFSSHFCLLHLIKDLLELGEKSSVPR